MSTIQLFDFSVNLLRAILWQYNEAANLQSLLVLKHLWYEENQKQFWDDWYVNVFDLNTANDFGLQVWSIILNIPIIVITAPPETPKVGIFFGDDHENFTNGNFAPGNGGTVELTVEQARQLLKMRYFQITTCGAAPEINQFFKTLFENDGPVYVRDNLDMTATYVFEFQPSSQLLYVLNKYDILPRPAGVAVDWEIDI